MTHQWALYLSGIAHRLRHERPQARLQNKNLTRVVVVRLQAFKRRTCDRHIDDELRTRAVYPERSHARHGKREAPQVDLTQSLGEADRRCEAELKSAHVRR